MNVVNVVPMRLVDLPPMPKDQHITVLRDEAIRAIAPRSGGFYVDATLGAGGHSEALLDAAPHTRLLGIDRDDRAHSLAQERLARFGDRVSFARGPFSALESHLEKVGVHTIDGLIADIGLSSMQLDDAERGMSFRAEGPLDMRMDRSSGETVLDLIERLDDDDLANVIYQFGEERRSRRIARCIKQAAAQSELRTTLDLRRAVVRAVGPSRVGGVDPATRTFQALRIAVNAELDELTKLLEAAARCIRPGGVVAIITFHSLEDRIVKHGLRQRGVWEPLTKKPVIPSDEEVATNPRSRSAKLRAARRFDGNEAEGAESDPEPDMFDPEGPSA